MLIASTILRGISLIAVTLSLVAIAEAEMKPIPDARARLDQLSVATSLDQDGLHPWHLRMSFQLYDLAGRAQETGLIEEWWVSSTKRRLEITSPSYTKILPSDATDHDVHTRASYLANLLLSQVVHPIPKYASYDHLSLNSIDRKFGPTTLSCVRVSWSGAGDDSYRLQSPEFCTEPGGNTLRLRMDDGDFAVVRNDLVVFQQVHLARVNALSYKGVLAITGKVELLEGFDPAKSNVEFQDSSLEVQQIPAIMIYGKSIHKITPEYPAIARQTHTSGSVVLCAVISDIGKISSVEVIASGSNLLTSSAVEAVKQWEYTPYLRDGKATEIETTIVVSYNIGPH